MLMEKCRKGSAILIVMLLITVLTSVALTVGYLAMAEVSMETSSEDGAMAYYAAEAGIEDGLLRYRYDNNVEVGSFDTTAPLVERVNVTDGQRLHNTDSAADKFDDTNPTNPPSEAMKQFYDLRIYYKTDDSGEYNDNIDFQKDRKIEKDQTLTLSSFGNQTVDVSLKYASNETGCETTKDCFVQFKGTNLNTGIAVVNFDDYTSGVVDPIMNTKTVTVSPNTELKIKPWNMSIAYKIKAETLPTGSSNYIAVDSGITTIESTGYYGSAKRRLQARVDRKSGRLLEIFDFVLNSTQNSIK